MEIHDHQGLLIAIEATAEVAQAGVDVLLESGERVVMDAVQHLS
ncbi:hypothetical protein [Candidatus Accumulibacter cognatus]|nr:hypothetical protein [Candidatus Accumulibacter cognatus]